MSSHINEWPSLKDTPEYQKKLDERVKKIEQDEKNYNHLVKVNDVLNVLDVSDEQEDMLRPRLETLDNEVLKSLTTKTRGEIFAILSNTESRKQNVETEIQNKEIQANDKKYQKIKNILPKWIYNWDPKFDNLVKGLHSFESLQILENSNENNKKKVEVLEVVLNELKNWDVLKSIINELGWANPNNPQYQEFKNTLIDLDPSFKDILDPLERIENKIAFDTDEIVKDVEKSSGWVIDIDLKSSTSKMKLLGSDYAFEEKLDKQALNDINSECAREMDEFKNGFAVLQGAYAPFGGLLKNLAQNWDETKVAESISKSFSNLDMSVFSELEWVYEDLPIDSNIQISQADIYSLKDVKSEAELRLKIENIQDKFKKIELEMTKIEKHVIQKYNAEFKELLQQKNEEKKRQLKLLKFFKAIGFDIISKWKTDTIIAYINRGAWKFGLDSPIDLETGNIGFNKDFWDKDISSLEKKHFIKLFNKMLGSDVVNENIANGTTALSSEAISRIQKLSNRSVGFFKGNLGEQK